MLPKLMSHSSLPTINWRSIPKSGLQFFCVLVLFTVIYYLTKVAVDPTGMGGPMNFNIHIPIVMLWVTLMSLLFLDVGTRFLPFSKVFWGILIAFIIGLPLHFQLIQTPYDCMGVGCGYNDSEAPADTIQYLLLFWLVLWFFLCPIYEWGIENHNPVNRRKRVLYSLIAAVSLSLLAFIYNAVYSGSNEIFHFLMLIGIFPATIIFQIILGSHVIGYFEIASYYLVLTAISFILIYLASIQGRHRWFFTILYGIFWFLNGDRILRFLYS